MSCLGPRALAFAACQAQHQTSWPWHLCRGMPQHQGQLKLQTRLLSRLPATRLERCPCTWHTGCVGAWVVVLLGVSILSGSRAAATSQPWPSSPPCRLPLLLRTASWQSHHHEPSVTLNPKQKAWHSPPATGGWLPQRPCGSGLQSSCPAQPRLPSAQACTAPDLRGQAS